MQGRIVVAVVAIPDPRADVSNVSERFVAVTQTSVQEPRGPHVVGSFTPDVAGSYVVKAVFLKAGGEWEPAANMSDYTELASGQRVEVRTTHGLYFSGFCQRAGDQNSTGDLLQS